MSNLLTHCFFAFFCSDATSALSKKSEEIEAIPIATLPSSPSSRERGPSFAEEVRLLLGKLGIDGNCHGPISCLTSANDRSYVVILRSIGNRNVVSRGREIGRSKVKIVGTDGLNIIEYI